MTKGWTFLSVVGAFGTVKPALACALADHAPDLFVLGGALVVVSVFVCALLLLLWGIEKVIFSASKTLPKLAIMAYALALVLGCVGSFAVPSFESVYTDFGAELLPQTRVLFAVRHWLWLPIILVGFGHAVSAGANNRRYFLWAFVAEVVLLILVLQALYAVLFKLSCVTSSLRWELQVVMLARVGRKSVAPSAKYENVNVYEISKDNIPFFKELQKESPPIINRKIQERLNDF